MITEKCPVLIQKKKWRKEEILFIEGIDLSGSLCSFRSSRMVLLKGVDEDGFVWSVYEIIIKWKQIIFSLHLKVTSLLLLSWSTGTQIMKVRKHII